MICCLARAAYGHGRDGMGTGLAPSRFGDSRPTIYPPGLHLSILSCEGITALRTPAASRATAATYPGPRFGGRFGADLESTAMAVQGGSYGIAALNPPNHNLSVYEV